jgi:tetratricopeptide (TPR) repeat protein
MADINLDIKGIENKIEDTLWSLEIKGELENALEIYNEAEKMLEAMEISPDHPAYTEQQRVLAYCLMRQGNLMRQLGKSKEALALSEREIKAAKASKDQIMLARSLMSNGTNRIVGGDSESGLELLEGARELFESGESYDHQQGLGWYWILQADLSNAGVIKRDSSEIIEITTRILEILKPMENWPGVARAYAARVVVHESTGEEEEADRDRRKQLYYESKVKSEESADKPTSD